MSKIKIIIPAPRNRIEVESVLGEYATLTIEYKRHANALNGELASVREGFEGKLDTIALQIKARGDALQAWADANPEEFAKAKSITLLHGDIGYRMGTGKLKTLARKTWDSVLETLRLLDLPKYIRTSEEVAKDQLITDLTSGELEPRTAKSIGVELVKEDKFFVEPKMEAEVAA